MKYLSVIALIFSSPFVQAEQVISPDFGFTTDVPAKMSKTVGSHEFGKTASFQGFDEAKELVYVFNVNQNSEVAKLLAKTPASLQEAISSNLEGYKKAIGVKDDHFKGEWKDTLSTKGYHFSFETTGFAPNNAKTYHRGVKVFHKGAFFTLQVISIGEPSKDSQAAFDAFLKSTVLVDELDVPADK